MRKFRGEEIKNYYHLQLFMIPIIYGIVLGFAHYISDLIKLSKKSKIKVVSLSAGVAVSYLFLRLLPDLYVGAESLKNAVFIFLLAGFVILHLIEKYVHQKMPERKKKIVLSEVHSVSFFIYHFMIGIILAQLAQNFLKGTLFFIPFLLHTFVSGASLERIPMRIRRRGVIKLILSASTLLGVAFFYLISLPSVVYYSLIAFVIGALLYVIIRDEIPKGKKGNPVAFLVGAIIYSIIILMTI